MSRDRFVLAAPLGRWQANCYVIGDRALGTAVVVDPGENGAEWVPAMLDQAEVACEAILLSHGHLDHIWAVPELAEALDVPVLLHPEDRWLWDDPTSGLGMPREMLGQLMGRTWDPSSEMLEDLADDQKLAYAGITFRARHTPGHTPGHVTFLADGLADADVVFGRGRTDVSDQVLFSGDLIFAGSVGRTDFPRGSHEQLLDSIARTVLDLEDDTLILSGHGPETTVGLERARNPFLAEITRRGI